MSKLLSLIFCCALLVLPVSMGCNSATETEPIGAPETATEDGATTEVDMQQE